VRKEGGRALIRYIILLKVISSSLGMPRIADTHSHTHKQNRPAGTPRGAPLPSTQGQGVWARTFGAYFNKRYEKKGGREGGRERGREEKGSIGKGVIPKASFSFLIQVA